MHKSSPQHSISNTTSHIQTSELLGCADSELVRSNIVFDGRYYRYRQYRYDLLSDAVRYAQVDASRPASQKESEILPQWVEVQQPTTAELQTMTDLNITFDGKKYRYGEYRYEFFGDAIHYAERNPKV